MIRHNALMALPEQVSKEKNERADGESGSAH